MAVAPQFGKGDGPAVPGQQRRHPRLGSTILPLEPRSDAWQDSVVSPFRIAPITAECLILCTALYVICQFESLESNRYRDAQRQWGAALTLQMVPLREGVPDTLHRQLYGPFDVWDGQWWRIPVNGFHHAGWLHLAMNVLSGWYLGKRLERQWGSLSYAVFLIPAILIPLLLEFLAGNVAIGFSGAICAILGALIVERRYNPSLEINEDSLQFGLALILLGIPATALDIFDMANLAHVSGVLYGAAAAWIAHQPGRAARVLFVAGHLTLVPGLWWVMHPWHNGRYLWYVADQSDDPDQRNGLLQQSIAADPTLTGAWMRLVAQRMLAGDIRGTWTLLVEGLARNPVDADLFTTARSLWRRLPHGEEREFAEAEMRRVFGDQADVWARQLRTGGLLARHAVPEPPVEPALNPADFPLDRPVDLKWEPRQTAPDALPTVDPEDPDSAREGRPL